MVIVLTTVTFKNGTLETDRVFLNSNRILSFKSEISVIDGKRYTRVKLELSHAGFMVTETPTQIVDAINNSN